MNGVCAAAFLLVGACSRVFNHSADVVSPRVVGYLASWGVGSKGTRIDQLPARQLTHIFYAFAEIAADGRVAPGDLVVNVNSFVSCTGNGFSCDTVRSRSLPPGNFADLLELKKTYPHLRLLISIGGWTGSGRFSDAALTAQSREAFARSAIDVYIRSYPGLVDGIDIDWEFPVAGGMQGNVERADDKRNFTLLLAELRRQLDVQEKAYGRRYELTIAASARPAEIANVEIAQVVPLLDFINVMTYDYHSGSRIAHFNAPLFAAQSDPTPDLNIDITMRAFLDAGVPANKLVLGIPFYGRAYGGVPNVNAGLFQPSSKPPADWKESEGDWKVLSRTRLRDPRYVRHWEPSARVPWIYDTTDGTWITYDDPESVSAKTRYVLDRKLGGVVIWELGGDDGALMNAISTTLAGGRKRINAVKRVPH